MKVIIDLIEDIRAAIENDKKFSLCAMGIKEQKDGTFSPSWEGLINHMKIDEDQKKLFLFLGKEDALSVGDFLQELNALSNEKMMYEVCLSYLKENKSVDSYLIGFGESLEEKKYLLFVPE